MTLETIFAVFVANSGLITLWILGALLGIAIISYAYYRLFAKIVGVDTEKFTGDESVQELKDELLKVIVHSDKPKMVKALFALLPLKVIEIIGKNVALISSIAFVVYIMKIIGFF